MYNVYLANVLLDCALRSMWFCTTTNHDVKCNITWRRKRRRRRVWARARFGFVGGAHEHRVTRARRCMYPSTKLHIWFSVCVTLFHLFLYRLACVISVARYPHCSFPLCFLLFDIRILTSRTVSVFALYMHIFHSVFLSHTAFSPKPNKPTGIRSLVIHFASIRFVWFFFFVSYRFFSLQ